MGLARDLEPNFPGSAGVVVGGGEYLTIPGVVGGGDGAGFPSPRGGGGVFGARVGDSDEGGKDVGPQDSLLLPGVGGPGRPEGPCVAVCRPGPRSAGRVSPRVTAGGCRARLGVARPLPHWLQLSGPRRLKEHPRRPVADERRWESGVCPRPAARASASTGGRPRRPCPRGGQAAPDSQRRRGRAAPPPPRPRWGN